MMKFSNQKMLKSQQNTIRKFAGQIFWIFFFIQLFILFIYYLRFRGDETGGELVVALFSIPPILQFLGLLFIKDVSLKFLYFALSLFSSGSYLISLLYYIFQPEASYLSGWLCISASIVLIIIAFLLTSASFKNDSIFPKISFIKGVASKIGTYPSGEILVLLAFFISIGYLISFALVFPDRHRTTQGLLPGLIGESYSYAENRKPESFDERDVRKPFLINGEFLFFNNGSAELKIRRIDEIEDKLKMLAGSEESLKLRDELANAKLLAEITNVISEIGDKQSLRITLVGRADDSRAGKNSYSSNYELALARANNVKVYLQNELFQQRRVDTKNIEWLIVPLSEVSNTARNEEEDNKRRSVEVSIQPLVSDSDANLDKQSTIRLLPLLDYVYFSIYTITTTGYGDIKPSTPYAKFVCTMANFYEVFFMVVFFNVLVSRKAQASRSKTETNKSKAAEKNITAEIPPEEKIIEQPEPESRIEEKSGRKSQVKGKIRKENNE